MNVNEITREPLDRFQRSPKRKAEAEKCIWACAIRLMEANDPEAPAHIAMIGQRIGLSDRDVSSAVKNAAKRSGWKPPASVAVETTKAPGSDVQELIEHSARAYLGDCPRCLAMMGVCGQESLMESHAAANHMTFDEMWNSADDNAWASVTV
jgi:hypothetical protein